MRTPSREWTYGELDGRARRVARRVTAAAGKGGGCVALLCAHDAPMVAGILGVLAAGKTYVPFDGAWPEQRMRHVLHDDQAVAAVIGRIDVGCERVAAPVSGAELLVDPDAHQARTAVNVIGRYSTARNPLM